jgi:hypothetical protein
VRFLRKWLVPILAGLMLLGIALAFVPLTARAKARAQTELSGILDTAFQRIEDGQAAADPVYAAEKQNLLDKARAVRRFLAHDDTLLATDALKALCEQLEIDRIDVADADGALITSSDETRIGLALVGEDAFQWTMGAINDPEAELVQADADDDSLLFCCVARSDIEGFILLTRDDPFVENAVERSSVEALIADVAYGGDVLFQTETGGADGYFYDSGNLCLRRTENGVTLIAARDTADVFAERNGALLALAVTLLCLLICGVAAYLLRLDPVVLLDDANGRQIEDREAQEALSPAETERDDESAKRRKNPPESDGQTPEEPEEKTRARKTCGQKRAGAGGSRRTEKSRRRTNTRKQRTRRKTRSTPF